jgi:lysophospholipid acyltransferase (LPLAT)-like uncharacterized protein
VSDAAETGEEKHGLFDTPGFRRFLGAWVLGSYLGFIRLTSRQVLDPPDHWQRVEANWPVIALSWHGQSNITYAFPPPRQSRWSLLISNHPDGQIAFGLAGRFGYSRISGSGMSDRQKHGAGGVAAYRAMLRALKSNQSLFMTADVPPVPGRTVSPGIIKLARSTGRPIYAMAGASSRRRILERVWDKMQLNFPFSRVGYAWEEPVWVTDPAKSDEEYAAEIAAKLDSALARAFALSDGKATS